MEPKKPALSSKSESEKKSAPWRPTKRQVLWAIGMVVALLTTAFLIVYLRPEIWKALLEERKLTLIAIGVSLTAIIVLLAIGGASLGWTGFGDKTFWDWLQLLSALAIPVVLAAAGLWFTAQQDARQQKIENQRAEAERELAEQRAQDEALQAYLDQMSRLMLDKKLLEAEPGDPVHTLAQARTSTVILRLDSEHNESVTRFLTNSGLAESSEGSPRLLGEIPLSHAKLSGAYLPNADLREADLRGADLRGADLLSADLSDDASLNNANLRGADLRGADLSDAGLEDANLRSALLVGANLSRAFLSDANLSEAWLSEADLSDAHLERADLSCLHLEVPLSNRCGITNEELDQQADSLEGATMPNGQKYEDWLKSKNREEGQENDGSS